MYLPYIRGKQFELIGLRELSNNILLKNKKKISPIIEPVKNSSTLKSTIDGFIKNSINFTIIVNPQVGTFKDTNEIFELLRSCIGRYTNYQVGIIFHNKLDNESLIRILTKYSSNVHSLSIIHNTTFDNVEHILDRYSRIADIKFNIFNFGIINKRYHRRFPESTLIELDDYFKSQAKNSDYLKIDMSDFSEEHLYFKSDGFVGFSDFLTFGDSYSDSGFMPYAIAIHLSFSDTEKRIKIKHFVSVSNDDISDIGKKFEQALEKLIKWCNATNYNSVAIPIFKDYYNRGHFPGLGTIKKLSLMNHIDLVLKLI